MMMQHSRLHYYAVNDLLLSRRILFVTVATCVKYLSSVTKQASTQKNTSHCLKQLWKIKRGTRIAIQEWTKKIFTYPLKGKNTLSCL